MTSFGANTAHKFLQLSEWTLGNYCSWDSYFTAGLVSPLTREVQARGNWAYYVEVLEPLQRAVIDMQRRGLLLDRGLLRDLRDDLKDDLRETDEVVLRADPTGALRAPTDRFPNSIGSSQKLGRFLFETLGLKPLKKTETGLASTDQESLYRLLRDLRKKDEHARPVLEALFHRSRLKTLVSRYLKLQTGPDGRVRARVKMTGTKTWRFAYAEPALQQWPPELRVLFRAAPGHRFVSVDYSQLEARILAYLSGDKVSIDTFESGGDVHTQNARDLGLDLANPTPARNFAKTFLYGISYGGAAETMKTKLYCPCPRCAAKMPNTLALGRDAIKAAEVRWYSVHDAVRRWHRELEFEIQRRGTYTSPLGPYTRTFSQPWGSELAREVKNAPMQLGAALLMNRRQVELYRLGAPIALQHHDSFLLEAPSGEVSKWATILRETLEAPIPQLGGVVFPCKVEVGETWGGLEPWEG